VPIGGVPGSAAENGCYVCGPCRSSRSIRVAASSRARAAGRGLRRGWCFPRCGLIRRRAGDGPL